MSGNGQKIYLEAVRRCIEEADTQPLLESNVADSIGGLSGRSTVGVLQRLTRLFAREANAAYAEIGVYQGLTLLSAAKSEPGMSCLGIDNFSILDPENNNLNLVSERLSRFGADNARLINDDFENALKSLAEPLAGKKIAIYFIDGPHDYRSQLLCLLLAQPHLHEQAVIVIDDANYPFVRQATNDFLDTHRDFKLLFEAYSPNHPANLDAETLACFEARWLNGVHILVRDPGDCLDVSRAPVSPDRSLYVNDWLVHRHGIAELAPEALNYAQAELTGDADRLAESRARLFARHGELADRLDGRPADRNTYSQGLTPGRFADFST